MSRRPIQRGVMPVFSHQNAFLLDPDVPHIEVNELLKARGGRMLDPAAINHNCPFCHKTMAWELFQTHARACYTRWRNTVDVKYRAFAGASVAKADA